VTNLKHNSNYKPSTQSSRCNDKIKGRNLEKMKDLLLDFARLFLYYFDKKKLQAHQFQNSQLFFMSIVATTKFCHQAHNDFMIHLLKNHKCSSISKHSRQ
jgi:hypothetical protein